MKVLVFAPHPDDEILGVGGTIAKRIATGDLVYICVVTKGMEPLFSTEIVGITRNEARRCHKDLGVSKTIFLDFPAAMLEKAERHTLNGKILDVIKKTVPDEVYIPHWGDMQKDHQIVADACMVALRPKYEHVVKRIYSYETLSETGWNAPNMQNEFIPNVYEDISDYLDKKLKAISIYKSQMGKFPNPRSIETIEALAKYRGSTVNVRAAEAFMLIREIKFEKSS